MPQANMVSKGLNLYSANPSSHSDCALQCGLRPSKGGGKKKTPKAPKPLNPAFLAQDAGATRFPPKWANARSSAPTTRLLMVDSSLICCRRRGASAPASPEDEDCEGTASTSGEQDSACASSGKAVHRRRFTLSLRTDAGKMCFCTWGCRPMCSGTSLRNFKAGSAV